MMPRQYCRAALAVPRSGCRLSPSLHMDPRLTRADAIRSLAFSIPQKPMALVAADTPLHLMRPTVVPRSGIKLTGLSNIQPTSP
jgi:hypothetical protein